MTAHWQRILRLQNWEIDVRWMLKSDDHFECSNGYCVWSEQHKSAKIVISKESEDIEQTVVHECLHLLLHGNKPIERAMRGDLVGQEFAINTLASVLTSRY